MKHKRVINRENEGEKRKKEEENPGEKMLKMLKMRKTEAEEKLPEGLEYEGGRKKTDEELAEEWSQKLKEREEQILKEETERKERMEKAKRMGTDENM